MKPIARKEDLVIQEAGDELLVYDLVSNKAKCLNEPSAFIWRNCDGTQDIKQIADNLRDKTGKPVPEDYVVFALDQLSRNKLLSTDCRSPTFADRISRREAARRIGLATVIALPVIASLVAPIAAQVASNCNVGIDCTCDVTGMTVGQGNPCTLVPGTGGCNNFFTCVCRANDNGNNFSGMCGL